MYIQNSFQTDQFSDISPIVYDQNNSELCLAFAIIDLYKTSLYRCIKMYWNGDSTHENELDILFDIEIGTHKFKSEFRHQDLIILFCMIVSPRPMDGFIRNPDGSFRTTSSQSDYLGTTIFLKVKEINF